MTIRSIYSRLLWLYPDEFRELFSQEMVGVFEQRVSEQVSGRRSAAIRLLLIESSSVVKGAFYMWLRNILSNSRTQLSSSDPARPVEFALNREEAARQRALAIQNMVAAIANHDFATARRYSDEEARLKRALMLFENAKVSRVIA
jgi:hypothetical protein